MCDYSLIIQECLEDIILWRMYNSVTQPMEPMCGACVAPKHLYNYACVVVGIIESCYIVLGDGIVGSKIGELNP